MASLMPPEWAPQDWLWIGFPHLAEEWPGWLEPAQQQIAAFANAVAWIATVEEALTRWHAEYNDRAGAPPESLRFLLWGAAFLIPIILAYTIYSYWVFRGKVRVGDGYH